MILYADKEDHNLGGETEEVPNRDRGTELQTWKGKELTESRRKYKYEMENRGGGEEQGWPSRGSQYTVKRRHYPRSSVGGEPGASTGTSSAPTTDRFAEQG